MCSRVLEAALTFLFSFQVTAEVWGSAELIFFAPGKEDDREGALFLRAQKVGDYKDTTKEQAGWPRAKNQTAGTVWVALRKVPARSITPTRAAVFSPLQVQWWRPGLLHGS